MCLFLIDLQELFIIYWIKGLCWYRSCKYLLPHCVLAVQGLKMSFVNFKDK